MPRIQTGMLALAVITSAISVGGCTDHSEVVTAGVTVATGQQTAPHWQKATNTDCLVWNPVPDPGDSVTWTGACVDGKANGPGTEVFRWPEHGTYGEQSYMGEMKAGKSEGHGAMYFYTGDKFEGEFSDGMRVRGTFVHANGDRYTGSYKNDKPNGFGTFTYASGHQYEGGFADGNFEGRGTSTDAAGSQYVGHFHHGVPNGDGTLRLSTGQIFAGHWVNGCLTERGQKAAAGVPNESCGIK